METIISGLRAYQLEIANRAAAILSERHLVYLAMEVRTGKTRTALYTAELIGARSVLFLTKKKAIQDISNQAAEMGVSFEIYIMNYEGLPKLQESWIDRPKMFDLVICDEAHGLGAFPKMSQRTRILKDCVRKTKVIYLSGTPTPESYSQIFHQFYISEHSPFNHSNFYSWAAGYVRKKTKYFFNREVTDYSDADNAKIDPVIKPYMISFTQEQAGFDETVNEKIIKVKMAESTYRLTKRLILDRVIISPDTGLKIIADTEVSLMQKLHQIYSGSCILEGASADDRQVAVIDTSKADYIRNHFAGKKIAIFYKFIGEERMLRQAFKGRLVDTPEQFNATGPEMVYISQVQSGREGINLSAADYLIMLNIDFSAVSYWQSRARLQTKDRERPAVVYWLFAEGGIEEKIYHRVLNKKDYTISHFKHDYNLKSKA